MPYEKDQTGSPIVYDTLQETQRVLVEGIVERLQEFLSGQREFEDAMTVEEYIAEVAVYSDGAVGNEDGDLFKCAAVGGPPRHAPQC